MLSKVLRGAYVRMNLIKISRPRVSKFRHDDDDDDDDDDVRLSEYKYLVRRFVLLLRIDPMVSLVRNFRQISL